MTMKKVQIFAFIALVSFFSSCSNEDNSPVNEEELITTVTVTFTSEDETVVLISRDLDGDGPLAPIVTVSGNFNRNTVYEGQISFENELVSPVGIITEEIEQEGANHQIFYQTSTELGSFTYNDRDENDKPIGLQFALATHDVTRQGELKITLRHMLNKYGLGVDNGQIANAGGSTDAEVVFPIVVE
jgi:hypothetical protein